MSTGLSCRSSEGAVILSSLPGPPLHRILGFKTLLRHARGGCPLHSVSSGQHEQGYPVWVMPLFLWLSVLLALFLYHMSKFV